MIILALAVSSCAVATAENPCLEGAAAADNDAESVASAQPSGVGNGCTLQSGTIFGESANALEKEILALVNNERRDAGVRPLSFSPELGEAASQHCRLMANEGFFDHRVGSERCLFDRVTSAGASADQVGENIFRGSQPVSAQQCVAMWMQSDGHRRNILSSDFDTTGVSVSYSPRGECYITQDFAHVTPVVGEAATPSAPRTIFVSHRSRRHLSSQVASRSSYSSRPLIHQTKRGSTRIALSSAGSTRLPSRTAGTRIRLTRGSKRQVSREKRGHRRSNPSIENQRGSDSKVLSG